ncbi:hypothetical protein AMTR_s00177p00039390 [Amborella trichopoda]|uniref:tRNA/rRNA methyltransferase SpoU type domain-containing protein n=2 Tax=Amborella trichopoda TaxID=13333 RepID=W1PRG2_AMBTC|nr:hypothetical protein AMTR_s00177p00039390 [Amborella trichopoda]
MGRAMQGDSSGHLRMVNQALEKDSFLSSVKSFPNNITMGPLEEEQKEQVAEGPNCTSRNPVAELLENPDDVRRLMKMERRSETDWEVTQFGHSLSQSQSMDGGVMRGHWFPYLNQFKTRDINLSSCEVLEALAPHILDTRKERMRQAVKNRSYSVCLVVEGLTDYGNVSAAFRSADALGIQSVHVVSNDSTKRYRENRNVGMGAEKWLDIELWSSIEECFRALRLRGYRIAATHVGSDAVSIYDLDWTYPTAIIIGNEHRGISKEALKLSDLHCSIPMKGMVDSFNASVAAGILMHHAVCDRTSRLGSHGDLTQEEHQILLAEFSLRHSMSAVSIVHEFAMRRVEQLKAKL